MLTQIKLTHFKCFQKETAFPLGQLNLLTGINGRGKSTLLQSLLLMRQSIEHDEKTTQILLNGHCVKLGNFDDIRNSYVSKDEIILFEYDFYFKKRANIKYFLAENIEDNMVAKITKIIINNNINILREGNYFIFQNKEDYKKYCPQNQSISIDKLTPTVFCHSDSSWVPIWKGNDYLPFDKIHYISADRIGPQDFYLKSTLTKFLNVGTQGEFTINILYKKQNELVHEKLCQGEDAQTLITQTEVWLNEIFDGAKVDIPRSEMNVLELFFNSNLSKDRFKPANSGFGFSYILPIVVSGLIAKQGEILIIENPEAHLHPKAQSRLAKFLARVSSCGVQIFIESHSDHILNGLRVAVLDEIITADDLNILYLQSGHQQPEVIKILVRSDGGIEEWPLGFFDQMDEDFERLFGM